MALKVDPLSRRVTFVGMARYANQYRCELDKINRTIEGDRYRYELHYPANGSSLHMNLSEVEQDIYDFAISQAKQRSQSLSSSQ